MLISFFAQIMAIVSLSLSMTKHFQVCFGKQPSKHLSNLLFLSGILLMCISLQYALSISFISLVYWFNGLAIEIVLLAIIYCLRSQK